MSKYSLSFEINSLTFEYFLKNWGRFLIEIRESNLKNIKKNLNFEKIFWYFFQLKCLKIDLWKIDFKWHFNWKMKIVILVLEIFYFLLFFENVFSLRWKNVFHPDFFLSLGLFFRYPKYIFRAPVTPTGRCYTTYVRANSGDFPIG